MNPPIFQAPNSKKMANLSPRPVVNLRGSVVNRSFTTRSLALARATENTEKFKISSFSFTGVLSKG